MFRSTVVFLFLMGLCLTAHAAVPTQLEKMTLDVKKNGTISALLKFSAPVTVRTTLIDQGTALHIEIPHAQLTPFCCAPAPIAPVKSIRIHNANDKLDFKLALTPAHGYRLSGNQQGKQVVIHLSPQAETATVAQKKTAQTASRVVKYDNKAPQSWVVAIDAGHGGKDTGAIGGNGIREKDVVLSIAKKLSALIAAEPNMKVVMVRKRDAFIDLTRRTEIARNMHADLFISLHADAYIRTDVRGSSVFTLSEHGATSVAAKWLADRENSADLVGGVKLRDKGKMLASVLLDLSQSAAMKSSDRAARRILRALEKKHDLHHREVQKAGFVVLKSPDVPSVLVETAFISNPDEEKNLTDARYQARIAHSIFEGIRSYFEHNKETSGMLADGGRTSSTVLAALQP